MRILSSDGLSLEAELDRVEDAAAARVVCHAHTLFQGTMKSPLLLAVRDEMVDRSWTVLRFNFRGVGDSDGEFSGGSGEISDVLGAIDFMGAEFGEIPVALLGWSFGGAVALKAAVDRDSVVACVGIAPAIDRLKVAPAPELGLSIPVLIVCGSNDQIVSPETCRRWAADSGATYEEVRAANHFFWAKYEAVTGIIGEWLEKEVV